MNLPGYLKPEGGIFRIDDAETIWGLVHYGIAVGTPDTPEVKRLRQRARQEVAAVASRDPGSPQYRRTGSGGGYITFPRIWVTVAGLAGLFLQHGHPCPWEQEAEPAQPPESAGRPGRPPINAGAYHHIETLMAAGSDLKPASLDAAGKYFPKADPQAKSESLRKGYGQWKASPIKPNKAP